MRHDELYLADALQAIGELREFLKEVTKEQFLADRFKQSFVFHRLVIIGEAVVSLRPRYESRYPAVPWARLAGLRNRLVHAYFDLMLERVWTITNDGLEPLGEQLEEILRTEFPDSWSGGE